jgi:hypothetical protein
MRLDDVAKINVGDKLIHESLGPVEFTEECDALMRNFHSDPTSMFVEHDGTTKEVSIALVTKAAPEEKTTFHVQINGGKEQTIETRTSLYELAALAALAMCEYEHNSEYDVVKIWIPKLLPEYGPYFYAYDGHNVGMPDEDRKW